MKENLIRTKSFDFALQIIETYKLLNSKNEYILSKQLLRSGTSIGANIHEGTQAQSKKDFVSKLSISLKEACETEYWLRLLQESDYLTEKEIGTLLTEVKSLIKILTSIIKTTRKNLENNL